ncbi:MAG: HDOD domain-containing protein [Candidatus Nitrohelix vancouverensis]|uniref:HDOD domain-containing protein n=1 Tax=Candidatus Nitrohelix vancouverensis TaxID=2705534 RepID=A0A7T0C314_9BACT|nr:MAG: HDOD domain-containing protein [Candidatus Nitrohelix vancouverensis]
MNDNVTTIIEDWVSSVPTVYLKLKKALEDPDCSFDDFAHILSADAALCGRVLKIVNSAFFGFSAKIETVTHALNILGTEQLNELALAVSVMGKFKGIPEDLVTMDSFWRHSIACGVISRKIASDFKLANSERYYVVGLLHDIGSLIIYKKTPDAERKVLQECAETNTNLFKVETKTFGFDHADVGGALLQSWKLSDNLYRAVLCHHYPEGSQLDIPLAEVIHIADSVAYDMGLGNSGERSTPDLDLSICEGLGIEPSYLQDFRADVVQEYELALSLFL